MATRRRIVGCRDARTWHALCSAPTHASVLAYRCRDSRHHDLRRYGSGWTVANEEEPHIANRWRRRRRRSGSPGDYVRRVVHLGVRVGGAAFLALSFKLEHEGAERGAQSLALLGVAMIVGGVISDVATPPAAYRRWNERHALGIVPAAVTPAGLAPGLSLTGRF